MFTGSPVQRQSGPNLMPEGHDLPDLFLPTSSHQCDYNHHEEGFSVSGKQLPCPLHFKLRENCCSGRSLQQMLEVFITSFLSNLLLFNGIFLLLNHSFR